MIYRQLTRAVFNSTEVTEKTRTTLASTLAFAATTSDALYLGFRKPFTTRYFYLGTVNTNPATVSVKYWDGEDWTAVEDLIDQTSGFTQSGFISWTNPGDWEIKEQTPIVSAQPELVEHELYWVKITVSANLSAGTTIQSILNLFCDESLFKQVYPEMVSDTRYLPSGQSNLIPQYEAAKNLVVSRLRQKKQIADESEILDINEVAFAAAHATAYLILLPIASEPADVALRDSAYKAMNDELAQTAPVVDANNSGKLEPIEVERSTSTYLRR